MSVIELFMRDVYCIVSPKKIMNWSGYKVINSKSESYVVSNLKQSNTKLLFSPGNYALKDYHDPEHWITFIVPGLRQSYKTVNNEDPNFMLQIMCASKELPSFKDISEYKLVGESISEVYYQLIGDITPYDVLHIKVSDLNKESDRIYFVIPNSNKNIELMFDSTDNMNYDFMVRSPLNKFSNLTK